MSKEKILLESEIRTILLVGLYEYAQKQIGDKAIEIFDWIDTDKYLIKNKFKNREENLTLDHLINQNNFTISNTLSNQIFEKAKELLPGDDPLYEQGKDFIINNDLVQKMSGIIKRMPPKFILNQASKENKHYNNILESKTYMTGKESAIIENHFKDGITHTVNGNLQDKHICNQYRGCLAGYIEILGYPEYTVTETECVSDGFDFCKYELKWNNKIDFKHRLQKKILTILVPTLLNEMQDEATEYRHLVFDLEEQITEKTKDYKEAKEIAEFAQKQTEAMNLKLTEVINELKEANIKLDHLARYDALTNIPNRQYFDEYFDQKWEERRRYSDTKDKDMYVILGDIDFFKQYNDSYGHVQGDDCLTQVAQTISNSLRTTDFVARYGGEEFVIITPYETEEGAKRVANKIISAINDLHLPHNKSSISDHVTISLGIAKRNNSFENTQQLLKAADDALYQSKQNGRNRHTIYENNY